MNQELIAGKYEVLAELGHGGMGRVYKVLHRGLGKVYALKVLHEHLAKDANLIARFHNEARIMASLRHPNIVQVFDIDRDSDRHYFVMEYIEGRTLGDRLKDRTPLPVAEAVAISRRIGEALAYAHQQQPPIIHRDIKPTNIMLESDTGRVVVTDFGIAKLLDIERTYQTLTGFTVGTPSYAAPEQLRSAKDLDGRADIFPLGLVMYEMLAGRPFFDDLTPEEIIGQKLYDPRELTPELGPAVPMALQHIIRRAIAKDREQRYPSVAALLEDLSRFENNDPVHAAERSSDSGHARYVLLGAAVVVMVGYWTWPMLYKQPETNGVSDISEPIASETVTTEPPPMPEPVASEPESAEPAAVEPVASEPVTAAAPDPEKIEPEPVRTSGFPPVIIDFEPQSEVIDLAHGVEQTFHIEAVDPDEASVSYQWFLDTQRVSTNDTWTYRPDPDAIGSYTVRVEVGNLSDASTEHSWRVTVRRPAPPPVLVVSPALDALTMTACSAHTFSVDNPGDFNAFRWLLDSEIQHGHDARFMFEPQQAGTHRLQLQAVADTDTITHRWRIDVLPPSISEADVNGWMNRYQQALQNQDRQALRQLGDLYSEAEIEQMQSRQRYQVTIERWNAVEQGGVVNLNFAQVERWYNPPTYSSLVEHTNHTLALQRQGCEDIVTVRK